MVLKIKTMWSVGGGGVQLTSIPLWIVKSVLYIPNKSPGFHKSFLKLCLIQNCIFLWQVCSLLRCFQAKGQIKSKAVWARRKFSQKMNERICFVCCEKQKSKQNKFVCPFLGKIYGASICFRFYLTFRVNFRVFVLFKFEFEWFANLLVILKALLNCEVIVFAQLSEWLKGPEASNLKLKKWKKMM